MTPDLPARSLAAAMRVMPAGRRDWGRAMQAELAAIDARPERRSFARGCLRAAASEFHLLRGAVHLIVVLGALGTMLAWAGTVGYPPLTAVLYVSLPILAGVCWAGRRVGMLGPVGPGAGAWLLRVGGYLVAGALATVALSHLHPATADAADAGVGVLVFYAVGAGFVLGLPVLLARRSAATARVLATGAGSGLAGALAWVVMVVTAPPIPATVGWALTATGVAVVTALATNTGRTSTIRGCLLAALLAATTAMALIFVAVVLLASYGPDSLIPHITPYALPADRISESRTEIEDPYVLILVLSGLAATALSLAAVLTRRPVVRKRSGGEGLRQDALVP
jgi:hypothetical protein